MIQGEGMVQGMGLSAQDVNSTKENTELRAQVRL